MQGFCRFLLILPLLFSPCLALAEPLTTPAEHKRPAEQTFLTYPEWFLVHSPAEYAAFVRDNPPNLFPYLGHVRQFWDSYRAVWEETRDRYPVNIGYHVMVTVIGVSTTIEYEAKAVYETLIGRLSLLTRGGGPTREEELAAQVAEDYVTFIRLEPWYKFDFWTPLGDLWTTTGLWGGDPIRKWERKYALTTEYLAKGIYAWLIGLATGAGYEAPSPFTAVILHHQGSEKLMEGKAITLLKEDPASSTALVLLPRYQPFTTQAQALALHGANFLEIAGNREEILVSVLATGQWRPDSPSSRVLFSQPLLSENMRIRYVLVTPIAELSALLRSLPPERVALEHIYDF